MFSAPWWKSWQAAAANRISIFSLAAGAWRTAGSRRAWRGCNEWEEFAGRCVARKLLGGLANVDDNFLELPTGAYRAVTLRAFDTRTRRWAIWWLDGRTPHQLDMPVLGGFEAGLGRFYADDNLDGRAIRVRFCWSEAESGAPRWEQAFSADGGVTWEINWVMRFSRAEVEL